MTQDTSTHQTEGPSPPKRVRQTEVARHAGVSPATVSKVINGGPGISTALRMKVERAMQELGFRGASPPVQDAALPRHIRMVTFFQFLTLDGSYFHAEVIRAISNECKQLDIELDTILLDRDRPNDLRVFRQRLSERPADALLFVGVDAPELLQPLYGGDTPVVLVNGIDPQSCFDCVLPASRQGSRMATEYLLAQGHRDIVHVTHLCRPFIQERLAGFRDALEAAGIAFDAQRHVLNVDSQVFSADRAAGLIEGLCAKGELRATALHCVTDYTAFGVIQGLVNSGKRVPDDYSVISFDDLPIAPLCSPPLTAVGIDRSQLGRMGLKRLLERFQQPGEGALRLELSARLSVRASVRRIGSEPMER